MKKYTQLLALFLFLFLGVLSCKTEKNDKNMMENSVLSANDYYDLKKKTLENQVNHPSDTANIFDHIDYNPATKKAETMLYEMGRVFIQDSNMVLKFDNRSKEELGESAPKDTLIYNGETFIRDLHNLTKENLDALEYNLEAIRKTDSADAPGEENSCRKKECAVYAHVSKKDQRLYLYINGEPLDTFKTSTGNSSHTTPDFDKKASGRVYRKYSSHKFPGGNWNGLGNMPYAVFIQGGYAIHGTTTGNIKRLGTPASHGCIRLHPRNAHVFWEVVNLAGPENTWITVSDE